MTDTSDDKHATPRRGTTQRVADWIADINSRDVADRPLGWIDGRYHCAARLAHVWGDEHNEELSVNQMAAALTEIRDNPDKFEITVDYREGDRKGRWQVFKGVFANVQ